MKHAGTIKLEIIKPLDTTWDQCGDRLRAMSRSLTFALNLTLRDLYVGAVEEIAAKRSRVKPDIAWRSAVPKRLQAHWNAELSARFERDRAWAAKNKRREPDASAYLPVVYALVSETSDLILSRFSGEHLQDLAQSRASFPSYGGDRYPFYAEGRECVVAGDADDAMVGFPLWSTGKRLSRFVVAPCGGHARFMWNQLVRDFGRRREIVDMENAVKAINKKIGALKQAEAPVDEIAAAVAERNRLSHSLEEMGVLKIGRVGISYNKNKHKWFALVSWTRYRADSVRADQTVAVNLGVNVFLQALTNQGAEWHHDGGEILVARSRFAARRKSLQKALNFTGPGGRGHGRKRLLQPITRLRQREHDWMQTKNRTIAAQFVKFCIGRGGRRNDENVRVGRVLLEDLTGLREAFEKKTQGVAHEEVKRRIHNWPFYALAQAIERECEEHNIEVVRVSSAGCSQRCPHCGYNNPENVRLLDRGGEFKLIRFTGENGERIVRPFKSWEQIAHFKCLECGQGNKGDIVTCANMLANAAQITGAQSPINALHKESRKRAKSSIKRLNRRKDKDGE